MNTLRLGLFTILTFLMSSCVTTLIDPVDFQLPAGFKPAEVESAIKRAAVDRGWVVEKIGDGKAELSLQNRSHFIKIAVTYSGEKLMFRYLDSQDMRYDGRRIHKKYHVWLDQLANSIKINLRKL